ncbi:hypothetical protein EI546_10875 [Aequorivita sp. H23M31]|uniref:Glycosyltransferase RgtA/B/C/D-like domain-containing protein n=1 Tax=Aequorivita ciconiae TaxID=2494375 RepID=A0A410G4P6_9FLAO|nr:glycosyltransferase family 39 protein [Aequorivita sp. H23M31]QAA82195.1 hypothetical protein EI546_10875 [Aequorivita sp. H23M31]
MSKKIILYLLYFFSILVFSKLIYHVFLSLEENTPILLVKWVKIFLVLSSAFVLFKLINNRKISNLFFGVFLVLFSLSLRYWWIFNVNTEPISDFSVMFHSAQKLMTGNISAVRDNPYFIKYPSNIPFTAYQAIILFFSNSVLALKILNVIFGTLIVWLVYKISKLISGGPTGRITGLISALYPPLIIYSSVLTNQTLSIFFMLLAIWMYFRKKNLIYVGAVLALANLIRPTITVFFIGLFVFMILTFIFENKIDFFKSGKILFLNLGKLAGSYFLVLMLLSFSFQWLEISKHGLLNDPIPSYKLLVGLNPKTIGHYSTEDASLTDNLDTFEENAKPLIKERLKDKTKLRTLLDEKFIKMWAKKDAGTYWAFTSNIKNKNDFEFITLFEQYFYIFLIGMGIIFILLSLKFQGASPLSPYLLFYLIILGFVLIYSVYEIQSRYRYEIYPLFILIAGAGFAKLFFKTSHLGSIRSDDNEISPIK